MSPGRPIARGLFVLGKFHRGKGGIDPCRLQPRQPASRRQTLRHNPARQSNRTRLTGTQSSIRARSVSLKGSVKSRGGPMRLGRRWGGRIDLSCLGVCSQTRSGVLAPAQVDQAIGEYPSAPGEEIPRWLELVYPFGKKDKRDGLLLQLLGQLVSFPSRAPGFNKRDGLLLQLLGQVRSTGPATAHLTSHPLDDRTQSGGKCRRCWVSGQLLVHQTGQLRDGGLGSGSRAMTRRQQKHEGMLPPRLAFRGCQEDLSQFSRIVRKHGAFLLPAFYLSTSMADKGDSFPFSIKNGKARQGMSFREPRPSFSD